jgi:IS5 family transposase
LAKRMRVEEIFGWMNSSAHYARSRWRGLARTQLMGQLVAAAYNLLRMGKLLPEGA